MEEQDKGRPVLDHIQRLVDEEQRLYGKGHFRRGGGAAWLRQAWGLCGEEGTMAVQVVHEYLASKGTV